MIAACGPFTTTDDLAYTPLSELLETAISRRASALVLLGPFVDECHPHIVSGEAPISYEAIFAQRVLQPIVELIEAQLKGITDVSAACITHFVLIPSTRDIHHSPIFPQPAFDCCLPDVVKPYVHLLPNPGVFNLGGVRVAASSVDVLMLLGQQEFAKSPPVDSSRPKTLERLPRLASHILQQRQFLPLLPVPADEKNVAVDVVANFEEASLEAWPQILLLPSDLSPFAKESVGGVLCVNPGRLTRKQAGGAFATVCVHPPIAVTGTGVHADQEKAGEVRTQGNAEQNDGKAGAVAIVKGGVCMMKEVDTGVESEADGASSACQPSIASSPSGVPFISVASHTFVEVARI